MYKQILVPLDGSPFGEHALPWALKIARRSGAAVTLLYVYTPLAAVYMEGAVLMDETLETDIKAQMQHYLDAVLSRVRSAQPGVKVSAQLVEGDVAPAIIREAAGRADLVVMTTHGRGPLGRFWLGSVADELVRELQTPLLLVRPNQQPAVLTAEPELKHILIPLDGSHLAEFIIKPALELGSLTGADYTLARMIRPVLPYETPGEVTAMSAAVKSVLDRVEEVQAALTKEAEEYLSRVAARLRAEGNRVETRVDLDQQPAHAIIHDAEEKGISLIALETHGRKGLSRLFLGSVADKVIRGAKTPVLVHRAH
jgi:nucleotide-binding universal stress UspA family protein